MFAGAMPLHAFGARAGAGDILAAAGDGGPGVRWFADVALLSAVSTCFVLGAGTVEQFGSSCSPVGHDRVRDQDLYRQGLAEGRGGGVAAAGTGTSAEHGSACLACSFPASLWPGRVRLNGYPESLYAVSA